MNLYGVAAMAFAVGTVQWIDGVDLHVSAGAANLRQRTSAENSRELVFDAAASFRIDQGNPNGAWSYGWMPTDFSTFNLDAFGEDRSHGPAWSKVAGGEPVIWKNTKEGSPWGVPPGFLSFHPGPGGDPSVLRWTSPTNGMAHIAGQFLPGDGGAMQVAVRREGTNWWHAVDSGSFDLTEEVISGDAVDFAVYGGYGGGNTPLDVTITLTLPSIAKPVISRQPASQTIWTPQDVVFTVRASGAEPLGYQMVP